MSAIWGHIDFLKDVCTVSSMASEYKRKCKLDKITEKHFANGLFGSGIQFINEEDEYEEMPYFLNEEGGEAETVILADCILDNREDLVKELTDGENDNIPSGRLICLAYRKWGYELVKHMVGIYSVAIYDVAQKKLFLFTDRTSSRCLYYYKRGSEVTFSTLISPIRKLYPDIPKNEMYLKDYLLVPGLMPNLSSTETPYENIFIIEAGCSITITEKEVVSSRYWSPEVVFESRDMTFLKDEFLKTYRTAVKRASRTSKNVAIALSGGFDSASVAALAAPLLAEQGKSLISYTYVPYYDMSKYFDKRIITNESGYVKEIAKMYPNIETNFTNNEGKSFWGYLDELIDVMEIPFKAFVNLPQLVEIYRAASERGCKVFLNGQTGNASVSYGDINTSVYNLVLSKKYFSAFTCLNKYCKKAYVSRKKAFPEMLKRLKVQKEIEDRQLDIFEKDEMNPFVNYELTKGYHLTDRNKSGMRMDEGFLKKENFKYEVYTLPALSYIGAMETKLGLYTGLVIRDATRDMDILNYCLSYPFENYTYDGIPRYLIRGFMKDLLPKCIIYPILKKGAQSTDWIYRLSDSKHEILETVMEETGEDGLDSYLNVSRVTAFINTSHDMTLENEKDYTYFFMIHIFVQYIKKYMLQT